jgi:hypothetical protein
MSDRYDISFEGAGHRIGNVADVWANGILFKVVGRSGEFFYFGCTMTGQAAIGFRDLSGAQIERMLTAAGIDELEGRLRSGLFPPGGGDGDYDEVVFDSEQYDHLRGVFERDKRCLWQERLERGWICTATTPGGAEHTTAALCAGCLVPDQRTLCIHFMHPEIGLEMVDGSFSRMPKRDPLCNVGNDPNDGSDCELGGLECARRVVDTTPTLREPPADVAHRAVDEIDYFSLVYRDRYKSRVWSIPQARSIGEFFGDCEDADDFQHRVAALADLLGRLDPYSELDEGDLVDGAGNRVGSLVALERLMERDHPEAVSAVRTLRAISRARNAFPIHTRTQHLVDALRDLGIAFPPTDWRLAWLQVLSAFWSSLQEIRAAVQSSTAAE